MGDRGARQGCPFDAVRRTEGEEVAVVMLQIVNILNYIPSWLPQQSIKKFGPFQLPNVDF